MNDVLKNLLNKFLIAFRKGNIRATYDYSHIENSFNSYFLVKMSKSLSLNEISVLLNSTKFREEGLKYLKSNEIESGCLCLKKARENYKVEKMSLEALYIAETFQTAAESYFEYKRCNYDKAIELLKQSLVLTQNLVDSFEYSFGVRKFHLLRNIIHLYLCSRDFEIVFDLIYKAFSSLYDENIFPIESETIGRFKDFLSKEDNLFITNQIFCELTFLINAEMISDSSIKKLGGELIEKVNRFPMDSTFHNWLNLKKFLIVGDQIGFLDSASEFVVKGRGVFPLGWSSVVSDVDFLFGKDF